MPDGVVWQPKSSGSSSTFRWSRIDADRDDGPPEGARRTRLPLPPHAAGAGADVKSARREEVEEDLPRRRGGLGSRPKVKYLWQLPEAIAPELVFVGRSNAGKSTLLNALLGHNAALTSYKAGKTRSLNWYVDGFDHCPGWNSDGSRMRLEHEEADTQEPDVQKEAALEDGAESASSSGSAPPKGHCLVDCFGLGPVSYSNLRARKLQSWGPLLDGYLSKRRSLTTVFHLVSSEYLGGLEDADRDLVEIFKRAMATRRRAGIDAFEYIAVLTKTDLLQPEDLPGCLERLGRELADLGVAPRDVVSCSVLLSDAGKRAARGAGVQELKGVIEAAAERGWSSRPSWEGEGKVRGIPKRSRDEAKNTRRAFVRSRVVDLSEDEKRHQHNRGGRGATTTMPSRV